MIIITDTPSQKNNFIIPIILNKKPLFGSFQLLYSDSFVTCCGWPVDRSPYISLWAALMRRPYKNNTNKFT